MSEPNPPFKKPSVPQFYFDLIARLLPGSILFTLVVFSVPNIETFIEARIGSEVGVSVLFGIGIVFWVGFLSYGIAISMWGIWFLISSLVSKGRWDPETLANMSASQFAERYEAIKSDDEAAGARLTKLKAELHMSATLLVGIVILTMYHAISHKDFYTIALLPSLGLVGVLMHVRTRIIGVIHGHPAVKDDQ